jgi:ribosomal protein L11 methyltransferase
VKPSVSRAVPQRGSPAALIRHHGPMDGPAEDAPAGGDDGAADRRLVSLRCAPAAAELLADRLWALGASSVVERIADPEGDGASVELVADLPAGALDGLEHPWQDVVEDPSWRDSWRDHARVWRAGPFVVRPPWLDAEGLGAGDIEVVVDPGGAFGSGSHPSTRGCLVALTSLVRPGDRVLDVGSGSGVLGVASLLAGAGRLVAVDVDPEAVAATRAVAERNGVAGRTEVSDRPLSAVPGRFDLVLANLLLPVVEDLGPDLVAHVADGGHLVVGGVLADQMDRALAALAPLRPALPVAVEPQEPGWATLVLADGGADRSMPAVAGRTGPHPATG